MSSKRKSVNQSKQNEERETLPLVVVQLAQGNGLGVEQILDWKTYQCGKVALVTTKGEKFIAERMGLDFLAKSDEARHDPQP